ncbi:MAG: hypothetical protein DRO16_04635 [Thermoprotei archaeon]|nr:MAG: hypothetical protein DRO16_04635 [Thermoprotei archaeon]
MLKNNEYKTLITAILVVGLLITILSTIHNWRILPKIKYYESTAGIIKRALNNSAEEEYESLLSYSNKLVLLGLLGLIIILSSIGLLINKDAEHEPLMLI